LGSVEGRDSVRCRDGGVRFRGSSVRGQLTELDSEVKNGDSEEVKNRDAVTTENKLRTVTKRQGQETADRLHFDATSGVLLASPVEVTLLAYLI
jgi:hypothetical protein